MGTPNTDYLIIIKVIDIYATLEKARVGAHKAEVMSDIGIEAKNPSKRTRNIFKPEAATKKELYQSIRKLISPPITAQFVSIDESLDSSKSESETSRKSIVDPLNIPQNIVDDLRKPKNPKTVLVK